MLHVETKSPGRRGTLSASFDVAPPAEVQRGKPVVLRDLIELTVSHELAAFAERRAERTLRRVLTERDLAARIATGTIRSGDQRSPAPPDADAAVATALEAFRDGLFLVVVDGVQYTELTATVTLGEQSTITYLRLVALAGG